MIEKIDSFSVATSSESCLQRPDIPRELVSGGSCSLLSNFATSVVIEELQEISIYLDIPVSLPEARSSKGRSN